MSILEHASLMTDEIRRVPLEELQIRLVRFREEMEKEHPGWQMAVINNKVNMYYFTGTMQEGALVIRPQDEILWVRRSYDRARNESLLPDIRTMQSFRTLAEFYGVFPEVMYVECRKATVDWLNMLRKYIPFKEYADIDGLLCSLRLVKSSYELELMKRSGAIHQTVLEQLAPKMIKEGISEAELAVSLYTEMLKRGSHGIARMNLPLGEDVIGVASFGKSGLVRTAFDGPGGTGGTCIAVQSIGSPFRKLKAGRLVYLDIPCGVEGYHTDKTIVYYFGDINKDPNRDLILAAHEHCIMLERFAAAMLKPGTVVEDIYNETMKQSDSRFAAGFMNGGKFLGHSIGLTMDESPAVANRFKEVLTEGMTFALEPKIALPGIGMVGSENTYLVTANGGKALTGSPHKLYCIY